MGWPPVRANRRNAMKSCKYVKVAVDGAPYLRKVDLEMYESYEQLLRALETMFCCLTIRTYSFIVILYNFQLSSMLCNLTCDFVLIMRVIWSFCGHHCCR